jgi:AcrR family transcriptional regulator
LEIVAAAAHAFALAGYHRTQMADISTRAGVALGTLYRYAASKEDLFAYALAYGVGHNLSEVSALMPIRDVEIFFTSQIPAWFNAAQFMRTLFVDDIPTPLPHALATLYDTLEARCLTIRIVDRSAHDLPNLGEAYSRHVREPVMRALVSYLEALQANDAIAPLADTAASARLALEVCAWFAMHRLFSPGGAEISDNVARTTALSHLVAAFGSRS